MDKFAEIHRRMSKMVDAPSMSSCFRAMTPFKVKVKFEIPLFEGKIDENYFEKWLSLL